MKIKILATFIIVVAALVGGYIYWVTSTPKELDEPFPFETSKSAPQFEDALDNMDAETKAEFEKAVEAAMDKGINSNELMPKKALVVARGDFKPRAHEVEGKALLIDQEGKKILRFEDFETINGPNLHIYLSSSLGVSEAIDLGKIKATKGSVNYELSSSIDISRYNKVLVWCVPFRILFSYAELE